MSQLHAARRALRARGLHDPYCRAIRWFRPFAYSHQFRYGVHFS